MVQDNLNLMGKVLTNANVTKLYGLSMTQYSAYAEIKCDGNTSLETILATADDGEIGYIIVDLIYYDKTKSKKVFSILSRI